MSYRRRGLGAVPWDTSHADFTASDYNPSPAFKSIYMVPGRKFLNQCRTKANPWGWVPGSGGSAYPTPMDITYTPEQWAQFQFDGLLANADALHAQGYTCPTTAADLQAIEDKSPFLHPQVVPPKNDTPLVNGWSGGFMPSPTTPAGNVIVNSSGAAHEVTLPLKVGDASGITLLGFTLPWYVWAGAAALGVYVVKGASHGK